MRMFSLFVALCMLVVFSGCNQGEIKALQDQVAELKQDKQALQEQLKSANDRLDSLSSLEGKSVDQVKELLGKVMPEIKDFSKKAKEAGGLGGAALKGFTKEQLQEQLQKQLQKQLQEAAKKQQAP